MRAAHSNISLKANLAQNPPTEATYSFIHQLMPISARRSCLETNAVFSFDTGTDNSLGKRATSSNASRCLYFLFSIWYLFFERNINSINSKSTEWRQTRRFRGFRGTGRQLCLPAALKGAAAHELSCTVSLSHLSREILGCNNLLRPQIGSHFHDFNDRAW